MKTIRTLVVFTFFLSAMGNTMAAGGHEHHGHGSHEHHKHHQHSSEGQKASVKDNAQYTVEVRAKDFRFFPSHLKLAANKPVKIILDNKDPVEHIFLVKNHKGEDLIHLHAQPNSIDQGTYMLAEGNYQIVCTIAGHTEAGMVGTIIVSHAH